MMGTMTMADWISLVADAAIVAFVIYRMLLIIRGTRAVPMLLGLAAITLLYALSAETRLNLPTFHWLLGQFIGSLLLIVVVLFQADIRRGLAAVGRANILPVSLRSGQGSHAIDELVKAATSLANQSIGALIILEREANLDVYMEESVKLDARLSKELLYSLFVPERQNPLHDGAVVVRNGRVAAAGVFLPMSVNPHIDRTLGTRHRAALGISEETDAVVLVVSEERGTVSVAVEGALAQDLAPNELRQRLTDLIIKRPTRLFRRDRTPVATVADRAAEANGGIRGPIRPMSSGSTGSGVGAPGHRATGPAADAARASAAAAATARAQGVVVPVGTIGGAQAGGAKVSNGRADGTHGAVGKVASAEGRPVHDHPAKAGGRGARSQTGRARGSKKSGRP